MQFNKERLPFAVGSSAGSRIVSFRKTLKDMQNFTIPDQNVFDEKAKEFLNSKLGKQLAEKYQVKPFEIRWKPAQIFAKIGSFLAHCIVILASSTFVFSYFISLFAKLPYPLPYIFAIAICVIVLFGIEWFKRSNSHELFKAFFQFGMKTEQGLRVLVMVVLMFISALFCYFGGFDFIELVSTPPNYQAPQQKDLKEIKSDYKGLVEKAEREAESYRQSKLYKGKLADEHAQVYKKLLDSKNALQSKMLSQIDKAQLDNEKIAQEALKSFEMEKQLYTAKLENRGKGLAHVSILFDVLLFLFIWFLEFYDWQTVIQYAKSENNLKEPQEKQASTLSEQTAITESAAPNEQNLPPENHRKPIGFFTPQPQEQQQINLWQQPVTQATTTVIYDDKYTIEHKGKRYNLARINNFINEYQNRIEETEKKIKQVERGKSHTNKVKLESTLNNRKGSLTYWLSRKNELLKKTNI